MLSMKLKIKVLISIILSYILNKLLKKHKQINNNLKYINKHNKCSLIKYIEIRYENKCNMDLKEKFNY